MAAGATYEPIATTTLASAAASYTFSSIPNTYTDLVLIANVSQTDGYVLVRVGSSNTIDSGSNYSRTYLLANGTSASSNRGSNLTEVYIIAGVATTNFAPSIVNIMNYANTSTYKTMLSRANDAASAVETAVFLWRSTNAINTIRILAPSGNLAAGTTFTLYGIAAA